MKVKLTTSSPYWNFCRQTPASSSVWDGISFSIDSNTIDCDYYVVYEDIAKGEERVKVRRKSILVTGEPPAVKEYSSEFLNQFDLIVSCHPNLRHGHVIAGQQALPWMIGASLKQKEWHFHTSGSYDELMFNKTRYPKDIELSVILSKKEQTQGHLLKNQFVHLLQEVLGDRLKIFGQGYQSIEDKFEVIARSRYHLALENSSLNDYWTEKLSDAFLCGTFPIYYGCTNIDNYFSPLSMVEININDSSRSINKILETINSEIFCKRMEYVDNSKNKILSKYQLFPMLANLIAGLERTKENFREKTFYSQKNATHFRATRFLKRLFC